MTQYENAPFKERRKVLGDTSEAAFESWAKKRNIPFVRLGFLRPPFKKFYRIDERLRLMPDYICEGDGIALIEVKGCGNEGLKIKLSSLDVMGFWNDEFHTVKVFAYNSSTKKYALVDFEELELITAMREVQEFSDGVRHYVIPIDELMWETP